MDNMMLLDLPPAQSTYSLLRYPGGKSHAREKIKSFIPEGLKEMVSPFLGGAWLELLCANRGIRVRGADAYWDLVNFWSHAKECPEKMAEKALEYYPLEKERHIRIRDGYKDLDDPFQKAVIFFVLNRTGFSGLMFAGMSTGHPNWHRGAIGALRVFRADNLEVEHSDFKDTLAKHSDLFAYCDPPYRLGENSRLYGKRGDMHIRFDHEGLAEVLLRRKNWILSYNDCDWVRDTYKDYKILSLKWYYSIHTGKKDKHPGELLILNV